MIAALVILASITLFWLFFFKKNEFSSSISTQNETTKIIANENLSIESVIETDCLTDDNGFKYRLVNKTKETARRTYVKAVLNGKYWGQIEEIITKQFQNSKYFDFYIYEATLTNAVYSTFPFQIEPDLNIPRNKLPKLLQTILENDGKVYEINLHEPIIAALKINRKLHQDDGTDVFGTIDAIVTGYILDFVIEEYTEKVYLLTSTIQDSEAPVIDEKILVKTRMPTGNVEHKGKYKRLEYFFSDYKKTYWKEWMYVQPTTSSSNKGFLSSIFNLIGGIISIVFLLLILPEIGLLIPLILIPFVLSVIPLKIYNWLFRIFGIMLFTGFIISLIQNFDNPSTLQNPKPDIAEIPQEQETQLTPFIDTVDNAIFSDSLIKHFRVWSDYDGNIYQGYIWTKKSDYRKAKQFKNNLNSQLNSPNGYDEVIYLLKENDKHNLNGVYLLFDSIKVKRQFTSVKFAELLVSFVQDIPYAIIVPDDCNPDLYDDKFIQEYLVSDNSICDGFERFGINSPVEFMTNLYGDCDTRTLLLYTMLAHYGFDVALLSSEYYNHSIIGINLPLSGLAYTYGNQRYVLWETTAPNIKAGVLPNEISNLNHWRISLKSM